MGRAPCCDKANVKKGPWSPQEDATLKSHIEKHGTGGNWIALPHKIGLKRCGKSCRLRWLNYLRPNIKHGGFTEDEDNLICTLYTTIGSRWSIIAAQLPGRTDNDIKNYWNTRLKKKLLGKHRRSQHQAAAAANKCPPPPDQTLIMPHLEASDFHYCNNIIPQQNNQANISEVNFQHPMWDNSTFIIDPSINLPYTGAAMPQLDAATAAITSSSVEYMSWGDTNPNSLIYPQSNYQIWTLFDDPMLLGYS